MASKRKYASGSKVIRTASATFSHENLTVSESAEKYLRLNPPQGYRGPFKCDITPYTREVMDTLTSRRFKSVFLVAPQQSGKTEIIPAWAEYSAFVDPADMIIYEKTKEVANDFNLQRIQRPMQASPRWREALGPKASDDNIFTKKYSTGAALFLSWPTINTLSGKPVPRCALTDYDRMPQDVDKNGSPHSLAMVRNRTFLSRGMTFVESSPGFPVLNPDEWDPQEHHPHQAPPCEGILGLYNQGDRRRWYWPHLNGCGEYFIPTYDLLTNYEELVKAGDPDMNKVRDQVRMACPHCGEHIEPGMKAAMNRAGVWLAQGQTIDAEGNVGGKAELQTPYASFWLPGPAAFRQNWGELVVATQLALSNYEETGEERAYKTVVQSDQCMPYIPMARERDRTASTLKAREERFGERTVPPGVRYLIATIDVQSGRKSRFPVMITGWGVDREVWVIDRFDIEYDPQDRTRRLVPDANVEDWRVLYSEVINRVYPLADNSGRWMGIRVTACDSGGADGVTDKSYEFYQWLAQQEISDATGSEYKATAAFMLVKGYPRGPRVIQRDAEKIYRDARGNKIRSELLAKRFDLNVNELKDGIDKMLERASPGAHYIHFPSWLPLEFYKELVTEMRDNKGRWDRPSSRTPNESWDLFVYALAAHYAIGANTINWEQPQHDWARAWSKNSLIWSNDSVLPHHHRVGIAT